ncbi:endolytic transglycosylase MltG [Phytohabitans kaempferiae]|uniref:Endolytic murein transglycosylase n=1 Tax=Phytohabitans kaempferiae TaxID=1620943 RepID=A0ABV6M1R9_9ACTN
MIDELELAFDDEPVERWRHRRGRKRGQKKRRGGAGKSVIALLVVVVMLGGLGVGVWYGYDRLQGFFTTPDYTGAGQGEVTIRVEQGDTATDIANTLVTADVVKSAKAFTDAAKEDDRSQGIQPGTYKVRLQMSGVEALNMLVDLKNKVVNGVLIREGLSAKATFKELEKATKIPAKEFEDATKDPIALGIPDWWFTRSDGKKVTPSIEGFLFPDTYEIDPKWTAEDIVRSMVDHFLTVTGNLKLDEKAQALNLTPYDVLIVASLAQAEAGIPEDLGKVARVAYNRLYGAFPCNCLEMDVTVNYWRELRDLPIKASKDMTQSELNDPKNPYNRKLRGLIPTPINNPGKAALEGAMAPPEGNWTFFVAIDKAGKSAFTNDPNQHERNKDIARQNGVL